MNSVHGGDIYGEDGRAAELLDFSANLNPLGMPDAVKRALLENADSYAAYPDSGCTELRLALSRHHGIPPDCIVCGNGAADLIYRLVLAVKPKQALLVAPTFSEYEQALRLCFTKIEYHFLTEENGFALDESILPQIKKGVDILILCSPNNPTGIPIDRDLMRKIAERCRENGILLLADECFNEFLECGGDYSFIPFLEQYENIVILKAFTKIYAMAGLRLGYALSENRGLIALASTILQPWSVSAPAQKCGIAALTLEDFVRETRALVTKERAFLAAKLAALGFVVFPSKANFLLFKSENFALREQLLERGILIRSCADYKGLSAGYYRIAVRTRAENIQFIAAITAIKEQE